MAVATQTSVSVKGNKEMEKRKKIQHKSRWAKRKLLKKKKTFSKTASGILVN